MRFSAAMYSNIQDCDEGPCHISRPHAQYLTSITQSTTFGSLFITWTEESDFKRGRCLHSMPLEAGRIFFYIFYLHGDLFGYFNWRKYVDSGKDISR